LWITNHVGTMAFFFVIFAWTVLWLGWNMFSPIWRFDPAPAFVLWLFISNLIQIMLMPLIMVGQNVQGAQSEARAEHDLEVNVKAENEIEVILQHLEYQNGVLIKMMEKLNVDPVGPEPAPVKASVKAAAAQAAKATATRKTITKSPKVGRATKG